MAKLIFENAPTKEYRLNSDGTITKKSSSSKKSTPKKSINIKETKMLSSEENPQVLEQLKQDVERQQAITKNKSNILTKISNLYALERKQRKAVYEKVDSIFGGRLPFGISRADYLETKASDIARKQAARTSINDARNTGKIERAQSDLITKQTKDILSTNVFERLLGNQTQAEKDVREQLQDNVALEYQSQLIGEQLRNAQSYLQGQSELLAVQQSARAQGIDIPIGSTDKTFIDKYGVPIALGVGLLILTTTMRGRK